MIGFIHNCKGWWEWHALLKLICSIIRVYAYFFVKGDAMDNKKKQQLKYVINPSSGHFRFFLGLSVLCILLIVWYLTHGYFGPVADEQFAKCLASKGVVMYGVDSCHYCTIQKAMFGNNFRYIHYIECRKERERCLEDGVTLYPTWVINGTKNPGLKHLDELAALTGCHLTS